MMSLDKPKIVVDIRAEFREWHRKFMPELDLAQGCFYWAVLSHSHLKRLLGKDTPILISAGTLSYPRINLDEDDGVVATHFSYKWEPNSPATKLALFEKRLPEMHVWIQMPSRHEIFDITTCYLKEQCEKAGGLPWLGPDPPDYIWCAPEELPRGVCYDPDRDAVAVVVRIIKALWGT